MRWILNGPALETFTTDRIAQSFFENAQPFVAQCRWDVPESWRALRVRIFPSFAKIQNAFASDAIGPETHAVLYDNEAWEFTPKEEQLNHAAYVRKAAELVHSHGLQFISAPAANLAKAFSGSSEKRYDAYIRLAIAADHARYSDVIGIQAQGSERDIEKYSSFVRRAVAQARDANPKVAVLAGISTNPSGQRVTADDIIRAVDATKDAVDGYWFNVPQPGKYCPKCNDFRPDIAIEVLRRLAAIR